MNPANLKLTDRIGRRGLLLILGGLSWTAIGITHLFNPMERFSSPGDGTDTILQILDGSWIGILWIIAGTLAFTTGAFRKRWSTENYDALGYNAFLTPPLVWMLFYAWSFSTWLATDGREGQFANIYAFVIYALISLFIMVVAGWPEAYANLNTDDTEEK
jgi:hypothetical protein